jgi:DNA-binding CsgD family transcriptional regulator
MDDELSQITGLIYDTVSDDALWPEVLIRLAELCGAYVPAIGFFDPATKQAFAVAPRTDPADLEKFKSSWAGCLSLFSDAAGIPAGSVVNTHELSTTATIKATPIYNELLRPMGLGTAALGANIAPRGRTQGVLGLYKSPHHDQPFERDETDLIAKAVSHIARATELRSQMGFLRLRESSALVALERLRKGVLLFDATGKMLFANDLASTMLDSAGGMNGEFAAVVDRCLRKTASGGHGEKIILRRGEERSPLILTTMPLKAGDSEPAWLSLVGPAMIVLVSDADLDLEFRATLGRDRYGLTPAEANFAVEIAKGDGRDAAARRRGITISTAHTHLNRIFEKTGVTRQAELVRLLLDTVAL